MKKLSLSVSKTVIIALLCMVGNTSFASHIVGLYLTYTYQGPNTYLLHLKMYRDCSGIPAPMAPMVCCSSASTGGMGSVVLDTVSPSFYQVPLNSCATQGTTWCQGGSYFGIEEYNYEGIVTLPYAASDWVFSYTECCRNTAITTLANNYGAYIETTLDNLTYPVNSSPQFNSTLFGLYCVGTLTNISYQCTDADGDSLVFRLDSLRDGSSCPVTSTPINYLPPYGYLNPVASFTPFTLNQSTGILSFTPALIQIGAVSFVVDEYRNGVKIGSIKRDDQLVIVGENPDPAIVSGNVYIDFNANNTKDAGEPGVPTQVVTETTTGIVSLTDANGDYSMNLIPGSFDLTTAAPTHFTVTPSLIPVNITTAPSILTGQDFALAPDMIFTDLTISITQNIPPRPGMPAVYVISVINNGTQINNGTISLTLDTMLTYDSSTYAGAMVNGNVITWSFSNLNPLAQITFTVYTTTNALANVGDQLTLEAEVTPNFPDKSQADNEDAIYPLVVNSFDPNYKTVMPAGDVPVSFITNGEYLDYEIHFQNTGTAEALYVKILDGLDANLDLSTLEFVSSSHPCSMQLKGQGLLTFEFNNIHLASMFVDELHSTGFARFRIKPKASLLAGDEILNGAGIIFDNNLPVVTQTVITRVVNTTGVYTPQNNAAILLYPNPVSSYFTVANKTNHSFILNIYDVTGRLVLTQTANQQKINVSNLNAGIYSYETIDHQNKITKGKFIKK
ncbi:MAG: T9SS type A sorting domain-containing protein [Bacteroidia bacterium]